MMDYSQAQKKSLEVEWEISTCSQGEECWCRIIKPVVPLLFQEVGQDEEYHIVSSGSLDKDAAEHFVKLHNENLKKLK